MDIAENKAESSNKILVPLPFRFECDGEMEVSESASVSASPPVMWWNTVSRRLTSSVEIVVGKRVVEKQIVCRGCDEVIVQHGNYSEELAELDEIAKMTREVRELRDLPVDLDICSRACFQQLARPLLAELIPVQALVELVFQFLWS